MRPSYSRIMTLGRLLYSGVKKESCVLANSSTFWPSGKRVILTIDIRAKVKGSIPSRTIAEGEIVSQSVASIVSWQRHRFEAKS